MKKVVLVAATCLLSISILLSVDEDVKKKFEKVQVFKGKDEVVKVEVMKPDIERYQKKTDTIIASKGYRLDRKIIRATNKLLLNKWLKELK
jgi:hypothetical protein